MFELAPYLATLGLAFALVFMAFLWFRRNANPPSLKLPPGPRYLTILEKWDLTSNSGFYRKCLEWKKKYGPIFRVPIGAAGVVVLNDMESINEFYCSRDGVNRSPEAIFFELTRGTMGMSNLDGKEWTENRSFSMRVFRDLGFGKTSMEQHIMEELQELVRQISDTAGSLISVLDYMIPSMSNVIAALLFGKRFELGDAKRDYVAKHLRRLLDGLNAGPVVEDKPKWLCRVTTALPFTRLGLMRRSRLKLQEFIKDQIREHESTLHPDINRDYIDGYLKKMKERHCEPVSSFQENYLLGNTVESLVGGSGPSSFRVFWLLHVCAQNPITVQSRIQKEIDDAVGHRRRPTSQDRKAMPFTMACLQEILRWKSLTPVGNQRGVLEDTFIGGYLIPKGSTVLLNSMGVHRNQEHWETPDEFDPSRFLTNDDTNLTKKYDHFVPFGLGRRNCPGKTLAYVQMFLYVATLLQRFRVFPEDEDRLPCLDSLDVTPAHPSVQKLRFVLR